MLASMSSQRLVAFLRGINLGGRRLTMKELRGHFTAMGLNDVATFLASGNVIFNAPGGALESLEAELEAHLERRLGYDVDTFIRAVQELASLPVLAEIDALKEQGFKPHVIFLKDPADEGVARSLTALETPDDQFRPLGREVLWLRRGGLSDAPITTGDLARALGGRTSTMRTVNTVRRIVVKFATSA